MRYTLAVILCVTACLSQEPQRSRAGTTAVGNGVGDPVIDYYRSISDYFRNSERAVMLISKKGVKDEEIPAVLLIARRSSASPNDVITMRQSGKSFEDIARQQRVTIPGDNFVTEANIIFLSEYHGRKAEEVRQMHTKGASFVALNQEFRRAGAEAKKKTEVAK